MPDRTLPEALVHWTIVLTWLFYAVGGLYVAGPVLVWTLGALAALSLFLGPALGPTLRAAGPVPPLAVAWIVGMAVMLVALWIGHLQWDLGAAMLIKSTVGWAKGWAMIAVLITAGAVLPIRRGVLVRAQCGLAAVTLSVLPGLLVAPLLGLPPKLFTSPLEVVGGPGPEYFSVYLYTIDPEVGAARWQFYAPWSPFAGMLGVAIILFALEEPRHGRRLLGHLAGLAMIFLSASRMSLVALVVCFALPRLAPFAGRAGTWIAAAVAAAALAVVGPLVATIVDDAIRSFNGARASSSRVRSLLQQIAWNRWQSEAIWFGHGTVERGPHMVEFMPIGSHDTWYGLLFVKGVFGVVALAVPMIWHFAVTLGDAVRGPRGRLPFGLMLLLTILTFGENLEIEIYLFWPAFLLLGIHLREMEGRSPSPAVA
ncbi:MAG: O-antigen ligase domain-containing protein [Phyllobacteriaceae bacterium]|nr:O-antigen ligase domain-containing protein [Phyllobacteriaceae bacterium]